MSASLFRQREVLERPRIEPSAALRPRWVSSVAKYLLSMHENFAYEVFGRRKRMQFGPGTSATWGVEVRRPVFESIRKTRTLFDF